MDDKMKSILNKIKTEMKKKSNEKNKIKKKNKMNKNKKRKIRIIKTKVKNLEIELVKIGYSNKPDKLQNSLKCLY